MRPSDCYKGLLNGGSSPYVYADDNPVSLEDSTGLTPDGGGGSCRKCTVALRHHHAFSEVTGEEHYFWETIDTNGIAQFDSGESQHLFLNHTTHKTGDNENSELYVGDKSMRACQFLQLVRSAGAQWPNNVLSYELGGPNSNTVASFINYYSFIRISSPPNSLGWDWISWPNPNR